MQDTEAEQASYVQRTDKLYMESNLLRIAGALFCHDPKRAGKRTEPIELNPGVAEKHIIIRPDPRLGQPGQLAHKIFVALIKKHSDYGRPVQNEIHFTRREIGRLIGRREWGGRDSEQLSRALHEVHYTFVTTQFKQPGGRYIEHSFTIFPELLIERREFPSDPIEACTITLAEPIVRSLADDHFTCLNHALMQRLGTIGQALYMRSFFHFANLYTGANASRLVFQKRYDDICTEWLGGLAVHRQKSLIEHAQLGPHLKQLVAVGFLSSYDLEKARGAEGFVLTLSPNLLCRLRPVLSPHRPGHRKIRIPPGAARKQ
jgi:replication initiator protein A